MSGSELFLVSGGSGGIGAAVCDLLAAKGFTPVVGYHRSRQAAEKIGRRTQGIPLALDLASEASIIAAVNELASLKQILAGVILAGSPPPTLTPFGKIMPEDMAAQWQVNVLGPQRLLAALVRRCFRPNKRGSVVGVLSNAMGAADSPAASGMGAYVIAKYGMSGMLAALAAEYPWLHVKSVSPGYTETPMLKAFDERFLELQRKHQTFQTPEEVAALIVEQAAGNG